MVLITDIQKCNRKLGTRFPIFRKKSIKLFVNSEYFPTFAVRKKITDYKLTPMSKICQITGKGMIVGNSVSHSNIKTKRRFYPNLQVKKFYIPEEDRWVTLKVSAAGIRNISKKGISACLKEAFEKGYIQ